MINFKSELIGTWTLLKKELLRFWRVVFQTVAAPVITAVLYLLIFSHVLANHVKVYDNVEYTAFLIPGLIMMSLLQIYSFALLYVDLPILHPWVIFGFAIIGGALLGTFGIIAGIWAHRFDQMAAFQNFVIMPLSFLSGVFYSIHSLPPFWQKVSQLNPFFYMIDGFRYGFFGQSDVAPLLSLSIVTFFFIVLASITLGMLKSGYKLRS
ncbi:MAG: metal-dependent hydrolase [Methylophilaceae bacterium]|nr:metal-dependent hydrolase [Methylophilaceae bacterium]